MTINQKGASAGGDVVGGNKTVHNYNVRPGGGLVEQLLLKLHQEMEADAKVQQTIEKLQIYCERQASAGPIGLEAKLSAANRTHEIPLALDKKEQFAKLLERWSLYASAQEIFVYLLARVEHEFSMSVAPRVGVAHESEINQIITDRIVEPTIADCGIGQFSIDHRTAMGMVYWLAEQCFIRWHK